MYYSRACQRLRDKLVKPSHACSRRCESCSWQGNSLLRVSWVQSEQRACRKRSDNTEPSILSFIAAALVVCNSPPSRTTGRARQNKGRNSGLSSYSVLDSMQGGIAPLLAAAEAEQMPGCEARL